MPRYDARHASALDITIGQTIRRVRLERGVSQERLAEMIGVTFQQVQKYEKGINRIAASRLAAVADALNCPVAALYPSAALESAPDDLDLPRVLARVLASGDEMHAALVYLAETLARGGKRLKP